MRLAPALFFGFYVWLSTNAMFTPLLLVARGISVPQQLWLDVLSSIVNLAILFASNVAVCSRGPSSTVASSRWLALYTVLSTLAFQLFLFPSLIGPGGGGLWFYGLLQALDKGIIRPQMHETMRQLSLRESVAHFATMAQQEEVRNRARMMGSISYALSHVVCGIAIASYSLDVLFLLNAFAGVGFTALLLCCPPTFDDIDGASSGKGALSTKRTNESRSGSAASRADEKRGGCAAACTRSLAPFNSIGAILFMCLVALNSYGKSLLAAFNIMEMRDEGLSWFQCGLMVVAQTILEVPLFFFGEAILRKTLLRPLPLFAAAAALTGVRLLPSGLLPRLLSALRLSDGSNTEHIASALPAEAGGGAFFMWVIAFLSGVNFGAVSIARESFESGLQPQLPSTRGAFTFLEKTLQLGIKLVGLALMAELGQTHFKTVFAFVILLVVLLAPFYKEAKEGGAQAEEAIDPRAAVAAAAAGGVVAKKLTPLAAGATAPTKLPSSPKRNRLTAP